MAGTIKTQPSIVVTNGSFRSDWNPGQISITQTTLGAFEAIVNVGTSEEDLTIGDVATPGRVVLYNLDAANFVKWGPKNGSAAMQEMGRLKAGEHAEFRMAPSGVTLRWIADTGACKVMVKVFED